MISSGCHFLYNYFRKWVNYMAEFPEYVMRLCRCGMRVDDAYTVVNDFYRELDFDGLKDYVSEYETITKIVNAYVD